MEGRAIQGEVLGPVADNARFYLPSLEGLRFFAFFLVFLRHLPQLDSVPPIAFVQARGGVGVPVFFALSAFLLFSLCHLEGTPVAWPSYCRFIVRRVLRVVPLVTVFVAICLAAALISQSAPAAYAIGRAIGIVLFVDNFICWFSGYSALPHTAHLWTLSYEMQFYPLIPLFAAAALVSVSRFFAIVAAVAAFAYMVHIAFVLLGAPRLAMLTTPFVAPAPVLLGMILSLAMLRGALPRISLSVGIPLAIAAIAALAILPLSVEGPLTLLAYPISGAVAAGALWSALGFGPWRWLLSQQPLVFLGKISYGLYVFHFPVTLEVNRIAVSQGLAPGQSPTDFAVVLAIALLITVALSVVSWFVLERPFLKLKTRFEDVPSRPV